MNIYSDMTAVLVFYGVFILAYASNIIFSTFKNIKIFHEAFNKKKLCQGIAKCLIFVVGTLLLVLATDVTAYLFHQYNLVNEPIGDMVTVIMIISTIGVAALKYIKEAYQTFVTLLTTER